MTCTFTNAKRPLVNVVKQVPTTIRPVQPRATARPPTGSSRQRSRGYGNNDETGFQYVPVGAMTVFEDGHSPTKLSSYYNNVHCTWDGSEKTGSAIEHDG